MIFKYSLLINMSTTILALDRID